MLLNIGCGENIIEGAVNSDLLQLPGVDVVWDLDDLPWPWEDGEFDKIFARSILEHLRLTLAESMNEMWRVLEPLGEAKIKVPYWRHANAYSDPTHRWAFDLKVFDWFDPSTLLGGTNAYCTSMKWEVLGKRMNPELSSIEATMRKVVSSDECRESGDQPAFRQA